MEGIDLISQALTAMGWDASDANVKTRADFSCAFFDRHLNVVAQAFAQPNHLGSLAELVPRVVRRVQALGSALAGGQVVLAEEFGWQRAAVHVLPEVDDLDGGAVDHVDEPAVALLERAEVGLHGIGPVVDGVDAVLCAHFLDVEALRVHPRHVHGRRAEVAQPGLEIIVGRLIPSPVGVFLAPCGHLQLLLREGHLDRPVPLEESRRDRRGSGLLHRVFEGLLALADRVDDGLGLRRCDALAGRSLLPVGVREVRGDFTRGELVACVGPDGREVAKGLVNYNADEARRIHYKEAPERGIRGVTSKDEADALEEEGIQVMPMPFAKLLKDPLQ